MTLTNGVVPDRHSSPYRALFLLVSSLEHDALIGAWAGLLHAYHDSGMSWLSVSPNFLIWTDNGALAPAARWAQRGQLIRRVSTAGLQLNAGYSRLDAFPEVIISVSLTEVILPG